MNLIGGLDTPNKGKIIVDGKTLSKKEKDLSSYREKYIGFIFQRNNLLDEFTVRENLNILGKKNWSKVVDFLKLNDLLDKKAKGLSGGEAARVTIARAILKNPKIILADEPTASIDLESKKEIMRLLKALSRDRLVILVSHDLDTHYDADILVKLKDGELMSIEQKNAVSNTFVIPLNKNSFDMKGFAFKHTFLQKEKFVRSAVYLILSFIFVMLSGSIASIDYDELHVDTMAIEKDDWVFFEPYSYDDKINEENSYRYLENNKISKNPIIKGHQFLMNGTPVNLPIDYPNNIKTPYFRPRIKPTYFSSLFDY